MKVEDLAQISSSRSPKLDDSTTRVYSDTYGWASFNLAFISGKPQTVILQFDCNGIKSLPTKPINVLNSIKNITLFGTHPHIFVLH